MRTLVSSGFGSQSTAQCVSYEKDEVTATERPNTNVNGAL